MTKGDVIPFSRHFKPKPIEEPERIPVCQLPGYEPGPFTALINEVALQWSAKARERAYGRPKPRMVADIITFPPKPPG